MSSLTTRTTEPQSDFGLNGWKGVYTVGLAQWRCMTSPLSPEVKIWTRHTIVLNAQVWSGHHPKLDQATSDLVPGRNT